MGKFTEFTLQDDVAHIDTVEGVDTKVTMLITLSDDDHVYKLTGDFRITFRICIGEIKPAEFAKSKPELTDQEVEQLYYYGIEQLSQYGIFTDFVKNSKPISKALKNHMEGEIVLTSLSSDEFAQEDSDPAFGIHAFAIS